MLKVFLIETEKEPEWTEPTEMSEWTKIKINNLENYNIVLFIYLHINYINLSCK